MSDDLQVGRRTTLDKDLRRLVPVEEAANFLGRRFIAPGLALLFLALAAASMDMFRDYAERGDRFAAAVARLQPGG